MEDTHVHLDDVSEKYKFPPDVTRAYYAVYDGHGGSRAAEIAKKYLHECILMNADLKKEITDDQVLEVVRAGYKRTDSVILTRSREGGMWNDGCTAVSVLVINRKLYIANVGDAEAVLARRQDGGLVAELLTLKHKPTDKSERDRIEAAGGHVVFGRVLGTLAVSRALGDSEFKTPRNKVEHDFVSCEPFTKTVDIDPDVPFLIIACDGLWDKVTYQEAVDYITPLHKSGKNPTDAAKQLVNRALEKGSLDNVSVIIVYFTW